MAYDHSKKIGNEGDLVKHAVLHECVNHLLNVQPKNSSAVFKYVEAHCGRAVYVLPEHGDWQRGIGDFSKLGWKSMGANDKKARSSLIPYFNEHLSANICSGQQYYGSSGIVFRILRRRRNDTVIRNEQDSYSLKLYDLDIHVCDDLSRYYGPVTDRVKINMRDGFTAVRKLKLDEASLVLIDPPDRKFEPVVTAVQHLEAIGVPYICWTTRFSQQGVASEHDDSANFVHKLPNSSHVPVRWMKPTGSNQSPFGCRLTVSDSLTEIARTIVDQLVAIMPERPIKNPKQRKSETAEEFEERKLLERASSWEKL